MGIAAPPLVTAEHDIRAPLLHKGKVRELYDLGEELLIVVTDRISAFDHVLTPPIPGKGKVLNELSRFWFEQTRHIVPNHMLHTDASRLEGIVPQTEQYRDRIMVCRKARRIDFECVVRGHLTGGGWRQYERHGSVNGMSLPRGLRKNERLPEPLFTPAVKNDQGHDEEISFAWMAEKIGAGIAQKLKETSLALYEFGRRYCAQRRIILADCKFEFGFVDGKPVLIDEIFTPDCARFWAEEKFALDTEIDSMDKEPVRTYLARSGWDRNSAPDPLPPEVVEQTSRSYREISRRLLGEDAGTRRTK